MPTHAGMMGWRDLLLTRDRGCDSLLTGRTRAIDRGRGDVRRRCRIVVRSPLPDAIVGGNENRWRVGVSGRYGLGTTVEGMLGRRGSMRGSLVSAGLIRTLRIWENYLVIDVTFLEILTYSTGLADIVKVVDGERREENRNDLRAFKMFATTWHVKYLGL